jgi:hypothetical protein
MNEIEKLYESVIKKSQENLELLGQKLLELTGLRDELIEKGEAILQEATNAKDAAAAIPLEFQNKFDKISKVSKEYLEVVGQSTEKYLEGNNALFTSKLNKLHEKTVKIGYEITRLQKIDPTDIFESHSKVLLKNVKNEFNADLKELDKNNTLLRERSGELKGEINRLKSVDLQANFDQHQKTLSDIFGAMNSVSGNISSLLQAQNNLLSSVIDQSKATVRLDRSQSEMHEKLNLLKEDFENNNSTVLEKIDEYNTLQGSSLKVLKIQSFIQLLLILILVIIYIIK